MAVIFKGKILVTVQATLVRKVVVINGVCYVSIPKKFANHHNLKGGDPVTVILNSGHLKIVPYEKDQNTTAPGSGI